MILKIIPHWFPWGAMAIWPFILTKNKPVSDRTLRHERIHHAQQKEMLLIPFYLWYLVEWIFRLFQHGFRWMDAYRAISFEAEAFGNEKDLEYRAGRRWFAWVKYL